MKLVHDNDAVAGSVVLATPPPLGPFTLLVDALRAASLMDAFALVRPVTLFAGNQTLRRSGIAINPQVPLTAPFATRPAHAIRYRALPSNILRHDFRLHRPRAIVSPIATDVPNGGKTALE